LRANTADFHDRVDRIFSTADLSERGGFSRFMTAQAAAHIPAEAALERAGIAAVIADWPARRRTPALHRDLAALGIDPPLPVGELDFADTASLLGGAYVLEGSRLGGALLRRSVPPQFPADFLATGDSAAWRGFLATLDQHLQTPADIAAATQAAGQVFMLFERSGQHFLKAN
jgi:heme oxygenase